MRRSFYPPHQMFKKIFILNLRNNIYTNFKNFINSCVFKDLSKD